MNVGRSLLAGLLSVQLLFSIAQPRTVGLLQTSNEVTPGYVLFSPIFARETYLIDKCGYLVNKWQSPYLAGQTAFLTREGLLLRTARIPGSITGGGVGGRMQLLDWDGTVIWSYDIANDSMHQHHVALPLEDGTIMAAVWKKNSRQSAINKGFIPSTVPAAGIVSDMVIHFRPVGADSITILWQWDFWDHTVQDYDTDADNYAVISDHPELLDVNFREDPGANTAEWIHLNAIDYDPVNNLVLVSSKFHNEIYVIDRSTTLQEARGHTGGKYGKGGDFIYRWGNPRSYGRGTREHHWLYGQHDVQFIDEGLPGAGNILLFNNGSNRTDSLYAVVEEIIPQKNPDGTFRFSSEGRFLPEYPSWSYPKSPDRSFYSSRVSGVQRLDNGNTLICEGNKGLFREVDQAGSLLWLYKNPVNNLGAVLQGINPQNTDVFTIRRYEPGFPGFSGRDLMSGGPLETGSIQGYCEQLNSVTSPQDRGIWLQPNPASDLIEIRSENTTALQYKYQIHDMSGRLFKSGKLSGTERIDITTLPQGCFILTLDLRENGEIYKFAFLKI